ncbi:hypothetical protein ACFO3D_00240 [Virgibacillus kekensis]|uniref:DUF945 family protein n=1 Tax=Virgibacillus kekensis TaxID=202261 RepID=A0ABV9DE11_9BACI
MGSNFSNGQAGKGGLSKKAILMTILAVLIIGGSAAAFVLLNLSAKQQYFLAEKNSAEFILEQVKERYEPELAWQEVSLKNPTETTFELSGEYNDPNAMSGGFGVMGPSQIINNSAITVTTELDREKKHMATQIEASMGGMQVGNIEVYMTDKKVMLGLPFLEELVQLNGDDLGKLLKEIDPEMFTGDEKLELDSFFERSAGILDKEDQEYIKNEYLEMIYDAIPDDAFSTSDETVNVESKSFDAKKITMHLTEKQLKDIIGKVLNKMESDERLKKIISEQIVFQQFGAGISSSTLTPDMQNQVDELMGDFETAIKEAQKGLEELNIPEGFKSVIWVHDDLIVKRNIEVKMGPSDDEMVNLTIDGSQVFTDTNQTFNYQFTGTDQTGEHTMTLTGDLEWKNNTAADSIKLAFGETELSYEGSETLKDSKREFERTLSFKDAVQDGSLIWSGTSSYDNDRMTSEHDFAVEAPGVTQDMFGLHIEVNAKTIDAVQLESDKEIKNIGNMSMEEINQYIENEVTPKFQQWIFGSMGGGMNGF